MAGFGLFADGGEKPAADGAQVAKEVVEPPATETSHHCWTPTRTPLVAMNPGREHEPDGKL